MHWLEGNISSETLISGQMFTIKMQFWFHSSPILPPWISGRFGEETRVSRKGRSGVTPVGGTDHQFAMKMLKGIEGQGWGTGLFLQQNLVPQAMNKSWVNVNPEAERKTAHTDSTWVQRTTWRSPWGLGDFSCVGLIMQNFIKSNMKLCWMTFVLFAQVLNSEQKLNTKTESEQWA